ncbi:MAG TPA: TldD/PmbA family protein [Chloroflexia bacterium]|nr:TldD/PmbA family protein [Chloroflexia bacterium]
MDRAPEILELIKPHVSSAETFAVNAETVKVGFKGGKLRSSEVQETSGVSIRVINEGKLGFYSTTDLTDKDRLLEATLNSAKYGGEATFDFAEPAQGEPFEGYSSETSRMDIQELAEMAQRLAAKVESSTNNDGLMVEVDLSRVTYNQQLTNTKGVNQKEQRSALSVSLSAQRVRGDDVLYTFNGHSAIGPEEAFEQLANKVIEQLNLAEKQVKMDTKEGGLPVVFTPAGSILLFYPLMLGLSGKNAFLGVSPLAGKLGEQLLDPRLTFVDEPIVANRPSSAGIDDEGVPTHTIPFFDKGVLTSYYYNLKQAGEAGAKSTGHGQRGMLGQPGASFHNPMIAGGDVAFKDLIGDIKEGLLVEGVLGLGQTNILAGQFSNPVSLAFKIENGQVVGRVKDVSIAGNVYELLKDNLGGISKEVELVYGQVRLPYIRLENVSTVSTN